MPATTLPQLRDLLLADTGFEDWSHLVAVEQTQFCGIFNAALQDLYTDPGAAFLRERIEPLTTTPNVGTVTLPATVVAVLGPIEARRGTDEAHHLIAVRDNAEWIDLQRSYEQLPSSSTRGPSHYTLRLTAGGYTLEILPVPTAAETLHVRVESSPPRFSVPDLSDATKSLPGILDTMAETLFIPFARRRLMGWVHFSNREAAQSIISDFQAAQARLRDLNPARESGTRQKIRPYGP